MPISIFEDFLKSIKAHPLVDPSISYSDYIHIDLSVNNTELKTVNVSSSKDLETFVWDYMHNHNAKVAYGGYIEKRGIYERSGYFKLSNPEFERNIHIGLDLWKEAGTKIYAPLAGTVHSFKNNTNYGDYGPTLILKHQIEAIQFYTLYGHLSLDALKDLEVGAEVKQGETIAKLGTAEVNGDYPPHLHFQIIRDIQNFEGDYPGVSNQMDLEFYKQNCPNPQLLFDF